MAARSAVNMFYLFCATVFLSAFLLFQIQPLIGKYILPWYGGTPAVWTVCMLFFQVLLFFGYAYAHAIVRLLSRKRQVLLHTILLAAAFMQILYQSNPFSRLSQGVVGMRFATIPAGQTSGWVIAASATGSFLGALIGGFLASAIGFNAINWMAAIAVGGALLLIFVSLRPADKRLET